ncbi:MAG: hypothetical protein N2559_06015 [Anaerolineae bacterium]|nr:hypothetical protein [Anaerolineae bacterium]
MIDSGISTRRTALWLFLLTFIVYIFPLTYNLLHKPFFGTAQQDVAAASFLPLVILESGDFTLEKYHNFFIQNWHSPYFVAEVNGRLVSRYPIAPAILAIPFYGIPLGTGWLAHPHRDWLVFPWSVFYPAKFAAAFITALAVTMFFFCACELADARTSALVTLAFAFGTSVWSTASQALWQHTPSLLFQLIGVWFVLRGRHQGALAVAPGALFFSAATIARANNALPALLFTLYVFIEYRAALTRWIVWAIPPVVLAVIYNTLYNGSPFVFGYQEGFTQTMSWLRLDGIVGLFLSPSRGLLIYSPFLALTLYGAWLARRESARRFYLFAALVFVGMTYNVSMFQNWDGGWGYGTRLLVDALPYLTFLLLPALLRLGHIARGAFWASIAYAAILQAFGLWDYGVRWHWHWEDYKFDVWDLARSEPLFYLRQYLEMAGHYLNRLMTR